MSEARDQAVLERLLSNLPGYTPELMNPRELGAAHALMQAYARLGAMIDEKLERVPERGLLAGLDMLGLHLLPAQAARTPLVFALQPDAPLDVTLPQGSQVAAKPAPPLPELDGTQAKAADPVVFSTEQAVTLARARLMSLYSVDPGTDRFSNHSASLARGFELFESMQLTPHHLYLGHDTLFKLGGHITLIISFIFEHTAREAVTLQWEYFTDSGWIPLPFNAEDDTTGGMMNNGQVTLRHECGPDAKKTTIGGRETFWLRARLATPLLREGIAPLITINDLRVRAAFGKRGLSPDAAFSDGQALDVSKDFFPFAQVPALGTGFALACKDAFARPGATVRIDFELSASGGPQPPKADESFELAWEYSTDNGWMKLPLLDGARSYVFSADGTVMFVTPAGWKEIDFNGVKQHWLRARIAKGDFGTPLRIASITATGRPSFAPLTLKPPMIRRARISFEYQTDPEPLDHCVTYNDFVCRDVTEAAHWPDRTFVPFAPVSDTAPAVHYGFSAAFASGLMSLFLDVPEAPDADAASPYVWEYRDADGWRELAVNDETLGFRQRGMIQFIGPQDAVAISGLGDRPYYWLRARLKQGEAISGGACRGVWSNAIWASERRRTEREIAGRSDGNPAQSFTLQRAPILAGEIVEVEEWVGRGEAWRNSLPEVDEHEIRFERDPATNTAVAAWVRWSERPHFFSSGTTDRHYLLERATGVLRFGRRVPEAGRRIVVTYSSGGGIAGNIAPGAAKELRAAVPYLNGASNVIAARGGAERERDSAVKLRGPQRLRHRGRGIAAQDLEWLALEASSEVARTRCLPLLGPDGRAQRGWVSLLVMPHSLAPRPELNGELARSVQNFLAARIPAGMRLRVLAPIYAPVSVRAVVVPADVSLAAPIEARVRRELNRFLHPLRGGRAGAGWQFGEPVHLSHIAASIEAVAGVEHAEEVVLSAGGVLAGMMLPIPHDQLVCAGSHELVLRMGAR